MFNAEIPSRAELPSTAQLVKSTVIAAAAAAVILVTVVLPAEYAIDPTGIGRVLQLTDMGEIKKQLAAEAEADRLKDRQPQIAPIQSDRRSDLPALIMRLFVSPAAAHPKHDSQDEASPETAPAGAVAQAVPATTKSDETVITLKPGEGVEYKLTMKDGAKVQYSWKTDGGTINYDMHGTSKSGKEASYKKGRSVASDSGVLTAGSDGGHGWFWRNRTTRDVVVTLKTNGAYTEIKRMN